MIKESGGANLEAGTTLSTYDMEKEIKRWKEFSAILNQPKPSTFTTPRQMVWKKNKATLWHYPAVEKKYDVPIFLIYSLAGRSYIMDLAPDTSVIGGLVNSGYDVYLLDWGIPGYEDKNVNLEDYIEDYIKRGVQRTLRHSGAKEISVIGYCLGGVLASIYASIAEEPIKNLIVAAVPIDWGMNVFPDKWVGGLKDGTINVDRLIDVYGLIPGSFIDAGFRSVISPIAISPYTNLLYRAYDKRFVAKWRLIDKWTKDQVPFAGEALRQLINQLIKENKLVKGEFSVRGKKVDLGNIKSNLLVITSNNDNLVIEEQSRPLMELVSSEDKTYQVIEAGHVNLALTGMFSGVAHKWLCHRS